MVARVGGYVLEQRIHKGTVWTHWRARREGSARPVKLAIDEASSEDPVEQQDLTFDRAQLSHGRIPRLLDRSADEGLFNPRWWLVFEWVPGTSLAQSTAGGAPVPPEIAAYVVSELARIADEAGLDPRWFEGIDAGSILLDPSGRAHFTRMPMARPSELTPSLVARYSYAAVAGRPPDAACAVFCAGRLLHSLLTGTNPFLRRTVRETAAAVEAGEAPLLRARSDLPQSITRVVDAALGLSEERLPDLRTLQHALRATLPPGDMDAVVADFLNRRTLTDLEANQLDRTLMSEVQRAPDGLAAYVIYGDYLQSKGELRGELIALQAEAARSRDEAERTRLVKAHSRMIRENAEALLGPLAPYFDAPGPGADRLIEGGPHYVGRSTTGPLLASWHMGFVRSLRVATDPRFWTGPDAIDEALLHLREVESTRLLRDLTFGRVASPAGSAGGYAWLYSILDSVGLPIRSLLIGDLGGELRNGLPDGTHESTHGLCEVFPDLLRLALRGGRIDLSPLKLPRLRELRIQSSVMRRETLAGIVHGELPRLSYLELWLAPGAGRTVYPEQLREVLSPELLPALRHLVLVEREQFAARRLFRVLAESSILPQLETVRLVGGVIGEEEVAQLFERWDRFEHLAMLDLTKNPIPPGLARALAERGEHLVVDGEAPGPLIGVERLPTLDTVGAPSI